MSEKIVNPSTMLQESYTKQLLRFFTRLISRRQSGREEGETVSFLIDDYIKHLETTKACPFLSFSYSLSLPSPVLSFVSHFPFLPFSSPISLSLFRYPSLYYTLSSSLFLSLPFPCLSSPSLPLSLSYILHILGFKLGTIQYNTFIAFCLKVIICMTNCLLKQK